MANAATPIKSAAKGITADAKPFDWEDPFFLDDQLTEDEIAIRDVARVRKQALSESDRLGKLVPDKVTPDKKAGETPFDFCYKESPELAAERESPNQLIRNTLKYAEKLEGSIRQTGVHA